MIFPLSLESVAEGAEVAPKLPNRKIRLSSDRKGMAQEKDAPEQSNLIRSSTGQDLPGESDIAHLRVKTYSNFIPLTNLFSRDITRQELENAISLTKAATII